MMIKPKENKIYQALIQDDRWSDFFIDIDGKDREIILRGIDEAEEERIRTDKDVEIAKEEFLLMTYRKLLEELSKRKINE
jgi:hypothetical protein